MIFKLSQMSAVSAQNSLALSTPSFIPGSRCMLLFHWVPSCVQRWETLWELTRRVLPSAHLRTEVVGEDVAREHENKLSKVDVCVQESSSCMRHQHRPQCGLAGGISEHLQPSHMAPCSILTIQDGL